MKSVKKKVVIAMAKLFVCSDIHSAYTPWMTALNEAGFDENNPDHKIVVCGDLLDRMGESLQVYEFAKDMINKGKMIYILGNHELLMKQCLKRKFPLYHDWHNGTATSIIDLAPDAKTFEDACDVVYQKMKPLWDKAVNYVEGREHIFVHSWIPTITQNDTYHMYNENWRNATQKEWDKAMWGNPFEMADKGLNQTGKVICFGHWHSSVGWAEAEGRSEFGPDAKFDTYFGDGFIAIDACTAHSKKCNVIVIEDEFI